MREEAERLIGYLADPRHDQFLGVPTDQLSNVCYTLEGPPPAPPPPDDDEYVDVLRVDDSGSDDGNDAPNAIRGLPRVWTATWQRLPSAAPPAVALVHGEGVQATAKAVAADLKRAAAAAAASLAPADGASAPPPLSYEHAQLEQAVDVLKGWRWRGTTSTKLAYLLSRLTDPALANEKAIVFTNHSNVLYYICRRSPWRGSGTFGSTRSCRRRSAHSGSLRSTATRTCASLS